MSDPQSSSVVEYANPFGAGQPFDSRFVVEEHDDGVSFKMMPDGLNRAAPTLAVLAAIVIVSLIVPVLAEFRVIPWLRRGRESWELWGLAMLFGAPSAFLWPLLLRAARRPTVIHVRGGRVRLFSGAAVFNPIEEWPAEEVVSASVVGRGVTRRLRTSADLVLFLRDGKSALLIAGHDLADLQWVAKGLSRALGKSPDVY
jgi:hypothetical protein